MEPIFLVIALCFNAACSDQAVYVEDVYAPADRMACDEKAIRWKAQVNAGGAVNARIGCRTQTQLEQDGFKDE